MVKTLKYQIFIGWDEEDITPSKPVELQGQYYQRISRYVRDPLKVTALALESTDRHSQAIMISADLLLVQKELQEELRNRIKPKLPDFDVSRLFINATHTHSAPLALSVFPWWTPNNKTMTNEEYHSLLLGRMEKAVVNAWHQRQPGGVSSVLGYAVVGHCRRTLYADGTARMYGEAARNDFIGMEGNEDHGVDMLFFWDRHKRLSGIIINIACPSQVMEATYCVSADFFGELKRRLRQKYSKNLFVLPQVSAAGDQSPRDLPRHYRGETNFWNEEGLREIGRRLRQTIDEVYPVARQHIQQKPIFQHVLKQLPLPLRRVRRTEYEKAKAILKRLIAREPQDHQAPNSAYTRFVHEVQANEKRQSHGPFDNKDLKFVIMRNQEAVLQRYQVQNQQRFYTVELHVIRLGNVAFASNPFELYLDYGHQIKARSKAHQTFLIQLAGDYGGYLPSARASAAGGYGALIINGYAGPAGGQMLVDETVKMINALWT